MTHREVPPLSRSNGQKTENLAGAAFLKSVCPFGKQSRVYGGYHLLDDKESRYFSSRG